MDLKGNKRFAICSRSVTVIAMLLVGIASASADRLVMKDGSSIETQGSWTVRDGQVVFQMEGGTLASVQEVDVDLAASRQATGAAQEATRVRSKPPEATPKKKAVFVLTDADVQHVTSSHGDSVDGAIAEEVEAEQPKGEVEVASWNTSDLPAGNGLRLVGSVRNSSKIVAAGLVVDVLAYDATDDLLLSAPATLGAPALGPGQTTTMMAELVGVFDYARVEFDLNYVPVESSGDSSPSQSTRRPDNG